MSLTLARAGACSMAVLALGVAPASADPGGAYAVEPERPRPPPLHAPLELEPRTRPRLVDVGVSALLLERLASEGDDGAGAAIHYDAGPGVAVHARIQAHRYLQVEAYFGWATHSIRFDRGALGIDGEVTADFTTSSWLDARVLPTLPLGDLVRLWGIVGFGWGRVDFSPARASDASGRYVIPDRGVSFFQLPLGIGGSVELAPGWLSLDLTVTAAPTFSGDGPPFASTSVLDGAGLQREIGPMPRFPVAFGQTLGLSLLL